MSVALPPWRNGRRCGLKIRRRKACGFDSHRGHQPYCPLIYEHVDEHVPEVSEVLRFMVEQQKMGMKEACDTLNMGIGYVAIVKPHDVDQVFETARVAGFEAFDAGVVERGEQEVIVPELGISYHHDE